ncbi:MAG TPA: hypothetical protein VKA84_00560 [Gemmatimonadaceae bacterium]|nr:hypothetical protein [Gemmatimonadaceae bacterium]
MPLLLIDPRPGLGWFITPTVQLRGEHVDQKFNDFPSTDIRNGGKFHGFMVTGAVAF